LKQRKEHSIQKHLKQAPNRLAKGSWGPVWPTMAALRFVTMLNGVAGKCFMRKNVIAEFHLNVPLTATQE
jgi:hypothetical protein